MSPLNVLSLDLERRPESDLKLASRQGRCEGVLARSTGQIDVSSLLWALVKRDSVDAPAGRRDLLGKPRFGK